MASNINMTGVRNNFDPVIQPKPVVGGNTIGNSNQTQGKDAINITENASGIINKNSNYETFLRLIKNMPSIAETMGDLFAIKNGEIQGDFANKEFMDQLMKLFEQLNFPKEDLAKFLKGQVEGSTKFDTAFFDAIRNILNKTNSQELTNKMLNFIKKYNDFAGNRHVLNSIFIDLESMNDYMGSESRSILKHLVSSLNPQAVMGEVKGNLEILQKTIVPFLGNYIKATNDFGTVRDLITSLVLNIARYENGSKEGVLLSFEALEGFTIVKKELDAHFNIHDILKEIEMENSENKEINETFVSLMKMGVKGQAGYENIDKFKQILTQLLINESVYVPLIHTTIPVNINNDLVFCDMWIDPDEGKEHKEEDEERKIRLFIKFEVKELGNFDVIVYMSKNTMDLQVFCPLKVIEKQKSVRMKVEEIVKKNGFKVGELNIEQGTKQLTVLDVFKKIHERKNAINVRI